jgi:lipopolysaccharide heptosyltransferase I
MKILFVKLGSIGDIVHTLPALAVLKKNRPDAEVSWVVEESSAELLRDNPLLSQVIEIDTKALRSKESFVESLLRSRNHIKNLRHSTFDLAIDFQGLLKSATVAKLSGAKRRVGFARDALREPASRFLLTQTVKTKSQIHVIQKNISLVCATLKFERLQNVFEFPIYTEAKHKEEAEKMISKAEGDFAILNPAGGWITKLWHAEKYGVLADKLWDEKKIASVVVCAPGESALAEKVLTASKTAKIIRAAPSLKGFYELAKRARIYVGGDTGPTHIAVAAGAPVVGIFGPTEWWRNGSPNPADICVERLDINCRTNCHRRTCGKWICMDITVEKVFEAIELRLNGASKVFRNQL